MTAPAKATTALADLDRNTERLTKKKCCPWCGAPVEKKNPFAPFDRAQCYRAQGNYRKALEGGK